MIILDTNVISALMSIRPDDIVVRWMDKQPDSSIWTSSVTVFEIASGIELLPRGRKRDRLRSEFDRFIEEDIEQWLGHAHRPSLNHLRDSRLL